MAAESPGDLFGRAGTSYDACSTLTTSRDLDRLRAQWKAGHGVEVGRILMESLTWQARTARAGALLSVCRERWAPVPAIDVVMAVARSPSRWREAHLAFDAVRELTLIEERRRTSAVYGSLLYVTEIVAQVAYDAAEPEDPSTTAPRGGSRPTRTRSSPRWTTTSSRRRCG